MNYGSGLKLGLMLGSGSGLGMERVYDPWCGCSPFVSQYSTYVITQSVAYCNHTVT